jgi:hypothetical protein
VNRIHFPRLVRLSWTIVCLAATAASAGTLTVPVQASVQGSATPQQIGSIAVNDQFAGKGTVKAGLTATFTFANAFKSLDDKYDFDWVQVATSQTTPMGSTAFFPGTLPTIDPKPSQDPDKYPFYYSMAEWNANTFAGQTIHTDNVSSTFGDVPAQINGFVFNFSTYLVVRDQGVWSLGGMKQFCVLGGFTWTYSGAGATISATDNQGSSAVGMAIPGGPIAAAQIDTINSAISNAVTASGNDATYVTWKNAAINNCVLVPEPSALPLAAWACLLLLTFRNLRLATRAGACHTCHNVT